MNIKVFLKTMGYFLGIGYSLTFIAMMINGNISNFDYSDLSFLLMTIGWSLVRANK